MAADMRTAPPTKAKDKVSEPASMEITPVTTEEKGIATAIKEGSNFFRQAVRMTQHSTVESSTMPTNAPKCKGAKENLGSSTNSNE